MSLSSPSTTAPVTVDNRVGQNYSVPQNAGSSTVGDISRNSTFRKPYLPGSELVQSPRELRDNAIDSLFDYETSGKLTRGDTSDPAWSVAAPENPDSMDIDLAHSAPSGPLPSTRPPGFQCSLELGPVDAISYLGDATLLGFSEDFVEFLGIHKVHELWISKFFAQNYIENTLSKVS